MRRAPAWVVVVVACAAQFLVVLDVSIVNVALPAIRIDLGFGADGLEWVVNAYALTFAGFLLLGGRAADVFGSTRVFIFGLALFVGASLVGGLAGTPAVLIAARAVQGVGAAFLSPTTLTVLLAAFPDGPRRVTALAAWSAAGSVGGAAGSVLGGVLTDAWSWRWVLLMNVPLGAVIVLLGTLTLPRTATSTRTRLDIVGAVSGTLGLASLIYGVSQGPTQGWSSWQTLVALGVGAVALVWFVLLQSRPERSRLLPLEVFRVRSFSWGNALMLLVGGATFPLWYFVSLYLQEVAGYSAIATGLAFLPHTIAMVAGARLSPLLLRRVGARALTAIGAGIAAVGFVWHAQLSATSPLIWGVLVPGALTCFGISLTFTPLALTTLALTTTADVGTERSGLASGVLNTARQVGGAIGLAVLTSVALATASSSSTGTSTANLSGFSAVFLISAAGCALVALGAFFLPSRRTVPASAAAGETAAAVDHTTETTR